MHKDREDITTYECLLELTEVSYKDSKEIYDSLYQMNVVISVYPGQVDGDKVRVTNSLKLDNGTIKYAIKVSGGSLIDLPLKITEQWERSYSYYHWSDAHECAWTVINGEGVYTNYIFLSISESVKDWQFTITVFGEESGNELAECVIDYEYF